MTDKLHETGASGIRAALRVVQLEQWPDSVFLTAEEMIGWAHHVEYREPGPDTERERLRRFTAISMALQYPYHIWYRTAPFGEPGHIGCRYGIEPNEYLSGFTP